jgi:hypothetical protein
VDLIIMNLKSLKHYNQADWLYLETELTRPELFRETGSNLVTDEQLFAYWKYITNNISTEIIMEDKYIKAWNEWSLDENCINTARIASKLSKYLLFAMGARPFSSMLMAVAARVSENVIGANNTETAQYINDHGFFLGELGNIRKAKALYLRAYNIRQLICDSLDPSIAESLNNLATLESEKKALPKLMKALEIRRKSLGSGHLDTLNSMRNVASTLDLLGKYEEANSLLLESIKISKMTYGEESAELASSLTYYSIYLWHNGQAPDAQLYAKRALDIKEKVFGVKNPELVINLISISEALCINDQFREALDYLNRALDISLKFNGVDHVMTNDIRDKIYIIEKQLDTNELEDQETEFVPTTIH